MGPFTTLVVDAAKWATVSLNKVYSHNLSTIEPSVGIWKFNDKLGFDWPTKCSAIAATVNCLNQPSYSPLSNRFSTLYSYTQS
jgi:hypothetical protein